MNMGSGSELINKNSTDQLWDICYCTNYCYMEICVTRLHPLMHFLVTGICLGHLFSFTCSNMSWTPQHTKTIKLHNKN